MIKFVFTAKAEKKFFRLQKKNQDRIIEKLQLLKKHPEILSVLKKLIDFEPATHRLRIGNYRLILMLDKQNKSDFNFLILDVGHRSEIYR